MPTRPISDTTRFQYLLGLSSPDECEHIESDYFDNEDAFQEMLTAEDDLIDAYARGELSGKDLRRFEKTFVSSLHGRDRVQFARAFAGAVSASRLVETKFAGSSLLYVFETFQSSRFLQTATIAAVIVFGALLAGLVIDRRRLSSELRELRVESVELNKRTEALQRSSNTERTHTTELAAQIADLRVQQDKERHGERGTTAARQTRHLPEVKNDPDQIATTPEQAETVINREVTLVGAAFVYKQITQPALKAPGVGTVRGIVKDPQGNVVSGASVMLIDPAGSTRTQSTDKDGTYVFNATPAGTYSLKLEAPGFKSHLLTGLAVLANTPTTGIVLLEIGAGTETVTVSTGSAEVLVNREDPTLGNSFVQKQITQLPLEARNVPNLLTLQTAESRAGHVAGSRADLSNVTLDGIDVNAPIRISSLLSWIRFQIPLETAAIHEDYRVTIKTADGRPVTSVNWVEPLTPNQTIIDTPVISTTDLPPGNYVLLLMGKETDGSFVKVSEHSFKIFRY